MGFLSDAWDVMSGAKRRREEEWHREQEAREQQERAEAIHRIVSSGQQIRLICGHSDVSFYGRDQNIAVLPLTTLYEPRSVRYGIRHTTGGGSGTHYKGISFYSGGSTSVSQSESTDELRMIGMGDFIITNQRVVFCSDLRTISMTFKEIVGTFVNVDGIRINKTKREKPYIFQFPSYPVTIGGREFYTDGPLVDMVLAQAMHLNG